MATLYLIPNVLIADASLQTVSQEVSEIIQTIDNYYVENTKNARRYLRRLGISKPIDDLHFFDLKVSPGLQAVTILNLKAFKAFKAFFTLNLLNQKNYKLVR
jgi:16S rRNA C1402 (ribose-2'-O) methylase RsmI